MNAERLWFFDESGLNLSFTRSFARSQRGERVLGSVPKNWGDSVTLMAAVGVRGLLAPMLLQGSLTGDIFSQYLELDVAPQLRAGDIFVVDNLGAHKTTLAYQCIEAAGATLLFLPPYSPDFNPIELAWAKLKTLVRGCGPRTLDALVDAVAAALRDISIAEIRSWIRHCGYRINS